MISGEKPYACKLEGCDKAFAQMANLQHHMRMHNKDGTKPHDPSEKPYKCDECFQEFHTQRGVNCHKQKVLQYLFLSLYKDFSSNFPEKQVLTKLFFFLLHFICVFMHILKHQHFLVFHCSQYLTLGSHCLHVWIYKGKEGPQKPNTSKPIKCCHLKHTPARVPTGLHNSTAQKGSAYHDVHVQGE